MNDLEFLERVDPGPYKLPGRPDNSGGNIAIGRGHVKRKNGPI